jgi:hypothetical protein
MKLARDVAFSVVVAPTLAAMAIGQEKTIKRSELPVAVQKTVVEQSQGATIHASHRKRKTGRPYTKPS